jgi:hypothetical protein
MITRTSLQQANKTFPIYNTQNQLNRFFGRQWI